MNKTQPSTASDASQLITNQIAELGDWRAELFSSLRQLVHEAIPEIIEEWKWDTAVWNYKGMICAAGVFKDHFKINFFKGASLPDPQHLFNAGLDAKTSRAIDFNEGDSINAPAIKDIIRAAAALNASAGKKK